jgi:alpha-tubulin suppressor-like RCC1 family protein
VTRRFAAPTVLACLLLALAFSSSAQAAGGTAMGWGYDYEGQVGNGAPITSTTCDCAEYPVPVEGLSEVTQIAGGYYQTVALHANGTVAAWGYNGYGDLGNGTTIDSPSPVAVSGITNAVQVASSDYHSLALLADGRVMAWGYNEIGQLGQGSTAGPELCSGNPCSTKPIPVPGISNAIAIGATEEGSVALLADGTVLYWGEDEYGEGGTGAPAGNGCECLDHPTPVPGVSGGMGLSSGWYLTSVLEADASVTAWGYNDEGQVGSGASATSPPCYCSVPVRASVIGGPTKETSSGGYHGISLSPSGGVSSWGYNYYGQLGDGTTETSGCDCSLLPVAALLPGATQQVSGGAYQSLALAPDGTVRAWGYNQYGAVGDGSTTNRPSPVQISITGASEVNSGPYTGFAVVGPMQKLKVAIAGAGHGAVGTNGLICPASNCENSFPQGQVKVLRAEAAAGQAFAGFSGPCKGTGPCYVALSGDQKVTATFGKPKGTKIKKAKFKRKKSKSGKVSATATLKFSTPGAITKYQCLLKRPGKHGKKPKFSTCKSPKTYKNLKPGKYTFKVRGLDILGADKHPAIKEFKVK